MSGDAPEDVPVPEAVRIRREAERARYEPAVVREILDAGLVAHVGTVRAGSPVVIPMYYVRDGASLLLHGAPATGVIRRAGQGHPVCVTVTLLDGLVLARSAFNHSLNYRSVVVVGEAVPVTERAEKVRALACLMERLVPGRQAELRPTTEQELRATAVLRLPLDQASAKVRTGPPEDEDADYGHPVWAGVVPIHTTYGGPAPDPRLPPGLEPPPNVAGLEGRRAGATAPDP